MSSKIGQYKSRLYHMTKNLSNENQGFNDTKYLANRNQGIYLGGELQKQF